MRTSASNRPLILERWLYVPEEFADPRWREQLTVQPRSFGKFEFGIKKPAPIMLYDESKPGYFGIPRAYPRAYPNGSENALILPIVDRRVRPEMKFLNRNCHVTPRDDMQRSLMSQAHIMIRRCNVGCILSSKTASGKTPMALGIADACGLKTLVLVPTEVIMEQWVRQAQDLLGMKAGIVQGSTCDLQDITVGMVQSVMREDKYDKEFEESFGLVITDECDRLAPEHFQTVVRRFPSWFRLGLTGTLKRKDGLDVVVRWHIGPEVVGAVESQVKPQVRVVEYPLTWLQHTAHRYEQRGKIQLARLITDVAADEGRTEFIIRQVYKAARRGRRILVLSDRREQVSRIAAGLESSGVPCRQLVGGLKKIEREQARTETAVIIATYQVAALGFDLPELDCLFFATPRSSVEQAVGRLLRTADNKQQPVIVDIVDPAPVLRDFFRARLYKCYKPNDYRIEYTQVY